MRPETNCGAGPRYLVLMLTEACNLRCVYCYRGEPGSSRPMDREVAAGSLEYAAGSGLPFHVQLTGGEPTLEPALVEWIVALIRKKGWPATVGLQTNGSLLDRSLVGICKHYDIQVGVSLDGPPEVQERMRGKAAATLRGLQLLTAHDVPFRVTTVVTGQNVHALGRLALLLGTLPTVRGLGLDLLVSRGRALAGGRVTQPAAAELKNGLQGLVRALNWINDKRPQPVKLREWELLKRAAAGEGRRRFCHAADGRAMAVLPDGSVYPCAQTAGDPRFACGSVAAPDALDLVHLGGARPADERCRDCPLAGFCPGDCPSRQHYNDAPDAGLACVMYRTLWAECKILNP
ncbi:MAG: radical SAM protein [Deltaproteobacteria bacterium]|nr:radical SAM protein [Deltaproteobacteria bacterium]